MADHAPPKNAEPKPPKFHGWMAEFADEDAMLKAARKVRDAGYTRTDAFTPFPVHGIDEALGIKPTVLPWIVLACGMTGTITAFTMEIWMNAVDYKYIISGKPFLSIPAFVPVGFELTILFSAFSAVIGMLALNGLFRFSNPVFNNPRFDKATDDRFFLFVDSRDKYFNKNSVRELLASSTPDSLDEVIEDSTPKSIPTPIWLGLVLFIGIALIPLALALTERTSRSPKPRVHVFFDMDFQPKKKAQSDSSIFEDGRSGRPQVLGTVARGQLPSSDPYMLGYDPDKLAANVAIGNRFVAVQEEAQETTATEESAESPETTAEAATSEADESASTESADEPAEAATVEPTAEPPEPAAETVEPATETTTEASPSSSDGTSSTTAPAQGDSQVAAPSATAQIPTLPFLTELPFEATAERMALGKTKYETYCSVCHGYAGDGNGLVAQRAAALAQGYWLPPTSLHDPKVAEQAVGQIYYTIANGKGKMGGYGAVLDADERWAVVLYVKALQRAKNAKIEDVPKDQRGSIEGPESN